MRMPLCNRLTRSRTLDITFLIIDKHKRFLVSRKG